jgi:1-acyl-sn-glycerol-3-phosphate acyltransferase
VGSFAKDKRPASYFARYHRRARQRNLSWQVFLIGLLTVIAPFVARVRVRGRSNIPKGSMIVAANHPSVLDPFFLGLPLRRRVSFMGKSDLFTNKAGRWLSRFGGFPVRRGVWDTEAFETAAAVLAKGRAMAMFPEGGTSPREGGYRDARPGIGHLAHITGATVLPAHIAGTRKLYKKPKRPWTWPKITVAFGEPIVIELIPDPSPERCQETAEMILEAIKALA